MERAKERWPKGKTQKESQGAAKPKGQNEDIRIITHEESFQINISQNITLFFFFYNISFSLLILPCIFSGIVPILMIFKVQLQRLTRFFFLLFCKRKTKHRVILYINIINGGELQLKGLFQGI